MANTFLTISMITYAMLPVLHNNTIAAKKVSRKYESQFAKNGAKIGAICNIRKPPKYTVSSGLTFEAQSYTETMVPLVVDQQKQVGVEFNDDDLTLSMDDFAERFLAPALVPLANTVDVFVTGLYVGCWNNTGTPGTTAATDTPFLKARAKLVNNAANMGTLWPQLVTPDCSSALSSGLAGRFNPPAAISKLYEAGSMNASYRSMGVALGWDFYESQNMPTQITGAWAANVPATGIQVDGANQTGSNILIKGAAHTITGLGKKGDVVQFAGVYMVNPVTYLSTGQLQDFVLTADVDSSGGGAATLPVSPAIILEGKDKTVTASPADSAQVYVYGTATVANVASQTSPQNLGWSEDAATLACVDLSLLPPDTGVKCIRVSDDDLGLSIMFTRGSDVRQLSVISRLDILYGAVLTRPEHMVRVNN